MKNIEIISYRQIQEALGIEFNPITSDRQLRTRFEENENRIETESHKGWTAVMVDKKLICMIAENGMVKHPTLEQWKGFNPESGF